MTDDGYALEWRQSSLADGASWIIEATERFDTVSVNDGMYVSAPAPRSVQNGASTSLNFTVFNTNGTDRSTSLAAYEYAQK